MRANRRQVRMAKAPWGETVRRFLRDERGNATIEFVIWIPWFMFLLLMVADASFLYLDMTRMENAARDGARRLSTGQYDTTNVDTAVLKNLPVANTYTISSNCSTAEYACVAIYRPVNQILAFNFMHWGDAILGEKFGAEIKMRWEPGQGLPTG